MMRPFGGGDDYDEDHSSVAGSSSYPTDGGGFVSCWTIKMRRRNTYDGAL